MPLREPVRQARITPPVCGGLTRGQSPNASSKIISAAQVLRVERLRQIGHGDDRKFQPLALVNAHQPHGVFRRDRRTSGSTSGLALRLDEFQKPEQVPAAETGRTSAPDSETVQCSRAAARRAAAPAASRRKAFPPASPPGIAKANVAAPVSASAKTVPEILRFSWLLHSDH